MKTNQRIALYALSFLIIGLSACTSTSLTESNLVKDEDYATALLLEKGTAPITADQAINVVKLFDIKNRTVTKSKTDILSDVYTHFNEEGSPVFYAVNRGGDNGFIIISASRKYYPVLAIVEKGHFDDSYAEIGLASWVDEQCTLITAFEKGEYEDLDCKASWSTYEKKNSMLFVPTKTEAEALALRQASVAAWEAQGYTCYALQDCPNHLPAETYNQWLNLASGSANPDYDYLYYSVILEKYVEDVSTTGPLIGSTWHQISGYNAAVPNNRPVGCVPVAIGQIMWYHEKPSTFFWSNMAASYATTATANFLYTLGCLMGIDYPNNSSAASHGDGEDALNYYGYTTTFNSYYNETTVINNIAMGKPVYIGGTVHGVNAGHAWVCEGSRSNQHHYEYELKILNDILPLEYTNAGQPCSSGYGSYYYLYHNLGFGGSGNGWYIGSVVSIEGTFLPTCMITNITPPSN